MSFGVRVKICGLKTPADIEAAFASKATYGGLVFFEKSPRHVDLEQARNLALSFPMGLAKVALVVNPTDGFLDQLTQTVPLDMLQLHGAEAPDRVAEIRTRIGLPVMKAVGIRDAEDLDQITAYEDVADQILVDAKPPKGADLPGGNGLAFDWTLLAKRKYWRKPWMLAGGLTPQNASQAVKATGCRQLDVSSGVESAPGVKDAEKMAAFVRAARS